MNIYQIKFNKEKPKRSCPSYILAKPDQIQSFLHLSTVSLNRLVISQGLLQQVDQQNHFKF